MDMAAAATERMRRGEPAFGCWIHLFDNVASEIIAQAGYDCVLLDFEHGPGAVQPAISVIQAVERWGCTPYCRIPANDPVWIKRVLDIGVAGVMVPAVNSPEQAQAVVEGCRYPPRGRRGLAATLVRASRYGNDLEDYLQSSDERLFTIVQIETEQAVANAAGIAAVEGIDMVFIGPFDLSADLGCLGQPDHPDVRGAIESVERTVQAAGKLLGGIPSPGRSAAELFAAGYRLVLAGSDVILLRDAANRDVAQLQATCGRT